MRLGISGCKWLLPHGKLIKFGAAVSFTLPPIQYQFEYTYAWPPANRYDSQPLGLKWRRVGPTTPLNCLDQLENDALASALEAKGGAGGADGQGGLFRNRGVHEFTEEEWRAFGVQDLRASDCIRAGSEFFEPAAEHGFTNAEWARWEKGGWLWLGDWSKNVLRSTTVTLQINELPLMEHARIPGVVYIDKPIYLEGSIVTKLPWGHPSLFDDLGAAGASCFSAVLSVFFTKPGGICWFSKVAFGLGMQAAGRQMPSSPPSAPKVCPLVPFDLSNNIQPFVRSVRVLPRHHLLRPHAPLRFTSNPPLPTVVQDRCGA